MDAYSIYLGDDGWIGLGGWTNWIEGDSSFKRREYIDWAGENNHFGMMEAWSPNTNCRSNYTAKLQKKYKYGVSYNQTHKPLTELEAIVELYQEIDPREPIKIPQFENMDSPDFAIELKKKQSYDPDFNEFGIQYQNWRKHSENRAN